LATAPSQSPFKCSVAHTISKPSRRRQPPRVTSQWCLLGIPLVPQWSTSLMQCTKHSLTHKNAITKQWWVRDEWMRAQGCSSVFLKCQESSHAVKGWVYIAYQHKLAVWRSWWVFCDICGPSASYRRTVRQLPQRSTIAKTAWSELPLQPNRTVRHTGPDSPVGQNFLSQMLETNRTVRCKQPDSLGVPDCLVQAWSVGNLVMCTSFLSCAMFLKVCNAKTRS
jgi:hypothetical protein